MKSVQLIERQARKELSEFYKRKWSECKEFHWPVWPLRSDHWKVLIMAARSSRIGCNGGLVNERGQLNRSDWVLSALDVLNREGMLDERRLTDLGWAMIEHFRTDEEIEPKIDPGPAQRRPPGAAGRRCR